MHVGKRGRGIKFGGVKGVSSNDKSTCGFGRRVCIVLCLYSVHCSYSSTRIATMWYQMTEIKPDATCVYSLVADDSNQCSVSSQSLRN